MPSASSWRGWAASLSALQTYQGEQTSSSAGLGASSRLQEIVRVCGRPVKWSVDVSFWGETFSFTRVRVISHPETANLFVLKSVVFAEFVL